MSWSTAPESAPNWRSSERVTGKRSFRHWPGSWVVTWMVGKSTLGQRRHRQQRIAENPSQHDQKQDAPYSIFCMLRVIERDCRLTEHGALGAQWRVGERVSSGTRATRARIIKRHARARVFSARPNGCREVCNRRFLGALWVPRWVAATAGDDDGFSTPAVSRPRLFLRLRGWGGRLLIGLGDRRAGYRPRRRRSAAGRPLQVFPAFRWQCGCRP